MAGELLNVIKTFDYPKREDWDMSNPKRRWLLKPFRVGEYTCASDARCLIAVRGNFVTAQPGLGRQKSINEWLDTELAPVPEPETFKAFIAKALSRKREVFDPARCTIDGHPFDAALIRKAICDFTPTHYAIRLDRSEPMLILGGDNWKACIMGMRFKEPGAPSLRLTKKLTHKL